MDDLEICEVDALPHAHGSVHGDVQTELERDRNDIRY